MSDPQQPITHGEIRDLIEQSTTHVFGTMLNVAITAGELSLKHASKHAGVTALLSLTGPWTGSGQVSCDPTVACALASQFLMAEYPEINEDVLDAVAELGNMIIGNVKNGIEEALGPMRLSAPVILSGGEFETRVIGNPALVAVPFKCLGGEMIVQLVLSPARRSVVRSKPVPDGAQRAEPVAV